MGRALPSDDVDDPHDMSFTSYAERLVLSPGEVHRASSTWPKSAGELASDALARLLRLMSAQLGWRVAVVGRQDLDSERSVATFGVEAYTLSIEQSPAAGTGALTSSFPSALAQSAYGSHPLVRALQPGEVLRGSRLLNRWGESCGVLLGIVSRSGMSPEQQTSLAEYQVLIERELERVASQNADGSVNSVRGDPALAGIDSEWLYREFLHRMPDTVALVFDRQLRYRLADGTEVLKRVGIERSRFLGQQLGDVLGGEARPAMIAAGQSVLAGESQQFSISVAGYSFEVQSLPIRNDAAEIVLGMFMLRDVTEQRRRELAERLLLARLHMVVESLEGGMVLEDAERNVLLCNRQFCELFGIEEGPQGLHGLSAQAMTERIGAKCFIPEAFEESSAELVGKSEVHRGETVYLADMRIFERDYSPLLVDGSVVGHLWVYVDVTQRAQSHDLLQRQADELRALSLVDELTGLYNRRGFLTLATQQFKQCDRTMRSALVVFVDLDGMKRINDELGHEFGDQALVETATVLRACFRYSDVIARLGGDEFVVLAVDADPSSHEMISARLYEKLAELNAAEGRPFQLGFSIGVADYNPTESEMIEEVLARADAIMYEQKRARRAQRQ